MRILAVHVPPAETTHADGRKIDNSIEKKIFLDALVKKAIEYQKYKMPCIILGTFNLHSAALYKEYLDIFAEYLTEVTSKDATYGNYKQDYIFVNEACKKLLKSDEVAKPHWTSFSTHAYLYIEISVNAIVRGYRSF